MAVTAFDADTRPVKFEVTVEPSDGSLTLQLTAWKYFSAVPVMLRASTNVPGDADEAAIEAALNDDIIDPWNALVAAP